jgi:hypothetical protein
VLYLYVNECIISLKPIIFWDGSVVLCWCGVLNSASVHDEMVAIVPKKGEEKSEVETNMLDL